MKFMSVIFDFIQAFFKTKILQITMIDHLDYSYFSLKKFLY